MATPGAGSRRRDQDLDGSEIVLDQDHGLDRHDRSGSFPVERQRFNGSTPVPAPSRRAAHESVHEFVQFRSGPGARLLHELNRRRSEST